MTHPAFKPSVGSTLFFAIHLAALAAFFLRRLVRRQPERPTATVGPERGGVKATLGLLVAAALAPSLEILAFTVAAVAAVRRAL